MRQQLISILTPVIVLGLACALAPAQSATIHLDADDDDGYIDSGQVVHWTLSVSFDGFPLGAVADSGNLRLIALVSEIESSDFQYTPTNGGSNGGQSDGAGGISFINWTNSLFLESFGGSSPDLSNPFIVGTFTTISPKDGVHRYRIEAGEAPSPFLTIAQSAFSQTDFTPEEVKFRVNGEPIGRVNPNETFDSSGSDEECVEALFVPLPNGPGVNGTVRALLPLPNGDLVVAGDFTHAGGQPSPGVARWDGSAWHPLGEGIVGTVRALTLLPNGDLVAGGKFDPTSNAFGGNNVVRWNGEAWAAVGSGLEQFVNALVVLPTGELVAGGNFNELVGSTARRVAMWDGSSWTTLGGGTNSAVRALLVLPSGDLVAAGQFTAAGGAPANHIARWDGTAWSPLSSGMNNTAHTLILASDGRLLAGGRFSQAGGVAAARVASWDGSEWSALGNSPPGTIYAFTRLDGDLVTAGSGVHRWNGSTWTTLEGGVDGRAILSTADGELLLGGEDGMKRWGLDYLPPRIFRQPDAAKGCPLGGAAFAVYSDGPGPLSYQWQVADQAAPNGWRSIENGDDPTLGSVSGAGRYRVALGDSMTDAALRCIVSNGCAEAVSEPATLWVDSVSCCASVDYSGDGVLDSADLQAFVALFLAHYPAADLNRDSVVDLGDIEVFVYLYLSGCG